MSKDNIIALTVLDKQDEPLMVLPFANYQSLRAYWRKTGYKWRAYLLQRVKPDEFNSLRSAAKVTTPDPGPVHRLLYAGERVMKGDEWYSDSAKRWIETAIHGSVPDPSFAYRRCTVGDGYRLLKMGEELVAGDELYAVVDGDDLWLPTCCTGMKVPPTSPDAKWPAIYRRKTGTEARSPDPPHGHYRMSSIEIIDRNDLFYNGKAWEKARVTGTSVGALVGMYARPLRKQTPDSTAGKDAETKHEIITT